MMTLPAFAQELGHRLPSQSERNAANQLRRVLAAQATGEQEHRIQITDKLGGHADIALSPGLSAMLIELLRHVGAGDAVTLVPVSKMLSTQQAADILNVSRPFLISRLENGDIPFELVGRHRRIKAEDLFAYKRRRDEAREAALCELAEIDAEPI